MGADPTVKRFWRFVRHWITHNHKIYYTFVVLSMFAANKHSGAIGVYNMWWAIVVSRYRRVNYHRSLDFAIQREKEWEINKPKDEDEEDEEEEEEAAEAPAASAGEEEEE